jgi:hypothetical protein
MKHKKKSSTKAYCDVCGRCVTVTREGEVSLNLFGISLTPPKDVVSEEKIRKIYPEFKSEYSLREYRVCWVCWLKSLGIAD